MRARPERRTAVAAFAVRVVRAPLAARATRTVAPVVARNGLALLVAGALASALGGCAWFGRAPGATPDNAPTLKTLLGKRVEIAPDPGIPADEDKAIAAYRDFLAVTPDARQRAQALRRLGDLSMASADNANAAAPTPSGTPDYRAAISQYRDYLQAYPQAPDNDRVLYQLARAQEQGGQLEASLQTLDQLVGRFPATRYRDEAEFRRGELLFTLRQYARAEAAYTRVLDGDPANPYRERALYMQGWSLFKQGRLEDALGAFFGVLDQKIVGIEEDDLDDAAALSRADRELVDDTLRVTAISLANLRGAETIPAFITSDDRRSYEFRVYQQLGALYLKQDRPKDAADTFGAFARLHPLDAQAPAMQARVIAIDEQSGFDQLALAARKNYVAQYGLAGEFHRANPEGWEHAQPQVKAALAELARRYHASAQKTHAAADQAEAVTWYRAWLAEFSADPEAPEYDFLLAELLFESGRYADAATEYEKTAYDYPPHAHGADAGYAALLAHAAQQKAAGADALPALQRQAVDSELRFAAAFPAEPRTPAVLTHAADTLYQLHDDTRAAAVAEQVLALQPPAPPAQRRVAWTVVAHAAFEAGAFDRAEQAYGEVLALAPADDPARAALGERLAAAIYKQGEQARDAGDGRAAVDHFARVATAAPQSAVRVNAEYDAAAALIALKDWANATRMLEDFRRRYPGHPLQGEVTARLALAYGEQSRWADAAAQYERIAAVDDGTADGRQRARAALWQAGELYDKAGDRPGAERVYERFARLYPTPLESAIEARYRLAQLAHAEGDATAEATWMKALLAADQAGGDARTERTRTLGATAALALAQPADAAYRQVALVEPLARQLKLKKARMDDALKAYAAASDYGVAEVTTAATYRVAALYQDFGHALTSSERPKKLSKLEREQYDVMLEEQAYPFEEKAIELHTVNARRASQGIYDEGVRKSFEALRVLQPVRYGKHEKIDGNAEGGVDAAAHASPEALAEQERDLDRTAALGTASTATWVRLGIVRREQGRFAQARDAYEHALALDPNDAAAVLDLGVLQDLYLGDAAQALALYTRYLALTPAGDPAVTKWIADLNNRKPAVAAPGASIPAAKEKS